MPLLKILSISVVMLLTTLSNCTTSSVPKSFVQSIKYKNFEYNIKDSLLQEGSLDLLQKDSEESKPYGVGIWALGGFLVSNILGSVVCGTTLWRESRGFYEVGAHSPNYIENKPHIWVPLASVTGIVVGAMAKYMHEHDVKTLKELKNQSS